MFKDNIVLNKKFFLGSNYQLINFVFAFFPFSFIFGNLITNINIVLFCILGIFHLRSKIFEIKFNLPIKIIFLFFFLIFFSTSLSFIKSLYFEGYETIQLIRLTKSIIFFRYFLLLLIIYKLSEQNVLNFKYFFLYAAFAALLVALDIIFQYIFGFNTIGLISHGTHNSGFFGEEWIAGGFIQNFSFFSILFTIFIFKDKKYFRFILAIFAICILGMAIVFSGNRAPLILFIFGLILIILFHKDLRKILSVALICFFLIFKFITTFDPKIYSTYQSTFHNIRGLITPLHNLYANKTFNVEAEKNFKSSPEEEKYLFPLYPQYSGFFRSQQPHLRLFLTAIDTWKKNKIFGNGIKSFRIDCFKLAGSAIYPETGYNLYPEVMLFKKNRLCSNHPHNYYFEILTETGIVGILITIILAILFITFILKNFKILVGGKSENFILLAATVSLILEVFPFKPTGSIFTTNDATYIILLSSIIISYYERMFGR